MSKKKSAFVTAIVDIMMVLIVVASHKIVYSAFVVIVSTFAVIGFLACTVLFCKWLEKPSEGKRRSRKSARICAGQRGESQQGSPSKQVENLNTSR